MKRSALLPARFKDIRGFAARFGFLGLISLSAHAADTIAPSTPGNFTATAISPTKVTLTWSPSTDNVGVTAYLIERCTGAGCSPVSQIVSTPSSPYTNTGLTVSTSYVYRIRARDAANNKSPYSPNVAVSTPADTTAPGIPTGVTVSVVSNKQLTVTWTAPTDDVAVTGYLVERCQGVGCSSWAQVSTPSGATYNNTNLIPNTSYSYRVRARDAANNISDYSVVASGATLPDTQAPTAPTNLTLTVASNTRINLAWTASTDDVGVTGYRVERCQGVGCNNFTQVATPTGVSYANTGLLAGSSYSYQVRATDSTGNLSVYTPVMTAVTTGTDATLPTIPTNLTPTVISGTQINLTWTASTDNNRVAGYRVERCQGSGCITFGQIGTPTATSFNDTGRTPNTVYRYRVRAVDQANLLSGYSSIVDATTASGVVDCD